MGHSEALATQHRIAYLLPLGVVSGLDDGPILTKYSSDHRF